MSELKLLNCPFCGGTDIQVVTDCGVIECTACNSYSCSADSWNTRHTSAIESAVLRRVADELFDGVTSRIINDEADRIDKEQG